MEDIKKILTKIKTGKYFIEDGNNDQAIQLDVFAKGQSEDSEPIYIFTSDDTDNDTGHFDNWTITDIGNNNLFELDAEEVVIINKIHKKHENRAIKHDVVNEYPKKEKKQNWSIIFKTVTGVYPNNDINYYGLTQNEINPRFNILETTPDGVLKKVQLMALEKGVDIITDVSLNDNIGGYYVFKGDQVNVFMGCNTIEDCISKAVKYKKGGEVASVNNKNGWEYTIGGL